ncbi:MAG TPA: toll/interleukin-1 receptor domain-containing protein [Candidatus Limnocylindrales bacterium]|nr:toll/interleukin-1 receptor domain-containing protein [Candidatus Limnocylindrales bacterium]
MRDTLLLSHANPEDNEFTLWLALQLANEGYRVWCDLTKLLGGEVFWDDIEAVIRTRTAKVLYVLTRTSNGKDGPLRELQLAQSLARKEGIQDFVIPLHIDDLPYGEVTIELTGVNATPFENSWAHGLATLLRKLEEDAVPKDPNFNRSAVNGWWRSQFSGTQGVRPESEVVFSNWFKIEDLPTRLYEHRISRYQPGLVDLESQPLPYPGVWLDPLSILTFAAESDFKDYLSPSFFVEQSRPIPLEDFLAGRDSLTDGPKYLAQLLRLAWDRAVGAKLSTYESADARVCYYFKKGTVGDDTVSFIGANGKKGHRGLVGYKTLMGGKLRYWHYALSAKPVIRPETLFLVKGHVLFSDDGLNLWTNKDQMAKARRNQCKNWWNDEWRDRMYAAIAHLANSSETVLFPLGATASFSISKQPIQFESPVSYLEPGEVIKDEDLGDYDFEDEDADDEGVRGESESE